MNRKSPPTDTPNDHPSCLSAGDPAIQVGTGSIRQVVGNATPVYIPDIFFSPFHEYPAFLFNSSVLSFTLLFIVNPCVQVEFSLRCFDHKNISQSQVDHAQQQRGR